MGIAVQQNRVSIKHGDVGCMEGGATIPDFYFFQRASENHQSHGAYNPFSDPDFYQHEIIHPSKLQYKLLFIYIYIVPS